MSNVIKLKTESIVKLQDSILMNKPGGIFLKVKDPHILHYQINGLYAREMWLLANTVIVGKTHKQEHLCIISKGIVKVVSEEFTQLIEAPYTYVSKSGTKRAMYAITDVVWTTIHHIHETDLNKVEKELVQNETYLGK